MEQKWSYLRIIISLFLCLFLTSCDDGSNFAPVTDLSGIEQLPKSGVHCVAQGETLYEVAWRYGLDYRFLAKVNQISAPYTIYINQKIYLREHSLTPTKRANVVMTADKPKNTPSRQVATTAVSSSLVAEPNFTLSKWKWPAQGRVIGRFSANNKGINIAGLKGEPIYSIGPGKVVYAGGGLRGYGNLIIIKHNSLYLSAYAHNYRVFVKEGDWVKQGQKIAEMGNTGTDKTMLHFEVRRAGKPINPMSFYQKLLF